MDLNPSFYYNLNEENYFKPPYETEVKWMMRRLLGVNRRLS